jgi:hypothetical protein
MHTTAATMATAGTSQPSKNTIKVDLISPSRGSPCLQANYAGLQRDKSRTEKEGVILISQVKSKGSAPKANPLAIIEGADLRDSLLSSVLSLN